MVCHTAPAAVSDQVMTERSFVHLSTGQAVHTAVQQHYDPQLSTQQSYVPGTADYIVPFSWLITMICYRIPPPPQKKTQSLSTFTTHI